MLLEANVLAMKEETYKYVKMEDKKEPCEDRLELDTLVWPNDF